MPTRHELIAFNRSEEEIAKEIGADRVVFQDLDKLVEAVSKFNPLISTFDLSVFTGCYVTGRVPNIKKMYDIYDNLGDVDSTYIERLEENRNEPASKKTAISEAVMGLHNDFYPLKTIK
jgi:amidophosphoribosyltransferase